MIDLIAALFKEGNSIKVYLKNSNEAVEGEIIKLLPSSIALKTSNNKIVGIKGDNIEQFEEIESENNDNNIVLESNKESINDDSSVPKNKNVTAEHIEESPIIKISERESKENKEDNKNVPIIQEYKAGDKMPLDVLKKRTEDKSDAKKDRKKLTSIGKGLDSLSILVNEEHEKENQKIVPAFGTICDIARDGRPFGFIKNGKDNKELFFSFSQIIDPELKNMLKVGTSVVYSIVSETLGLKAIYIHRPGKIIDLLNLTKKLHDKGDDKFALGVLGHILSEYPHNYDADKLYKIIRGKPVKIIKQKQKQENTIYQEAKRLHDEKKYEEAIDKYKIAIEANQKRESAIKDLGSLYTSLSNKSESEELRENYRQRAIDFMEDNVHYLPNNTVSWSYLENFYYSVREFDKFDNVMNKLLSNKQIQSEGQRFVFLLNKQAASYITRGEKEKARKYINKSMSIFPEGTAAARLLAIIDNKSSDLESVFNPSEFETLTSGLSIFIQKTLEKYDEYHGVPSKIIESGQFTPVTLNEIRKLIETAGKARARERAKYLLTEGKLMLTLEPDNILKLRSEMARYCNAMAQIHIFENSSMDITRFYYLEAFSLEERYISTRPQVALYLLTHCYTYTQLLNASSKTPSVDDALKIFLSGDLDFKKWESILSMFLYNREITAQITSRLYAIQEYLLKAKKALSYYGVELLDNPTKDDFVNAWNRVREKRIRDYKNTVTSILSYKNITSLEEISATISSIFREERKEWMCALDLNRITSIINNIGPSIDNYIKSSGYRNKESGYNNVRGQIIQLIEEIEEGPTRLSYEAILPLMSYIYELLDNSFNDVIKTSEPRVDVKLLSEETVVDSNNIVSIQVSVSNHKDSSPIREITVQIDNSKGVEFIPDNNISYNAIDGGDSSIFKLKLKVSEEIRKLKASSLIAICKYKSGNDIKEKSFDLSLKLYSPSEFTEINNPYSPIADGGPVPISSNMFFGRDTFISERAKSILNSPSKQIIIYGQKRCGKSSVMLHLKKKLLDSNKAFCIFFSMGDIINNLSASSFYYKILSSISDELIYMKYDGMSVPEFEIPSYSDFKKEDEDNPSNTFTKYMIKFKMSCKNKEGWENKNLVVMIDEFTYLYTEIKKGKISDSIMKQWKAVTQNERAQFSVVLVGQDVVPSFKKEEYASNAFGVIEDIRLTYLDEEPARDLIEKPILDESGESRYIGNAVSRILDYTSRNPYYIQIFCARLVDYMNKNKSIKVTEADVNEVAHSFVVGDQALEIDKFDNLIRAGESEDLQEIPEVEIFAVLRIIAKSTKNIAYCKRADICTEYGTEEDNKILQHLVDREVVEKKGDDNYKIQVKLFQEWLLNH